MENNKKTLEQIDLEQLFTKNEEVSNMLNMICNNNNNNFILLVAIFILACFVGYYVVWKVTPALHTPLMSVTNAISGIIIVGAMLTTGVSVFNISSTMGFVAVILASINIFGGFVVTTRMLEMFRKK